MNSSDQLSLLTLRHWNAIPAWLRGLDLAANEGVHSRGVACTTEHGYLCPEFLTAHLPMSKVKLSPR
ncbi:hypothetical protein SAMN05216386_0893 [Nitrosospira briensis]|uniref:Uncharacterized protein n=1 Tax=Nitrosospira briensis TaxID=35799 RepID=A0A1I4YUK6_9PROT|nr:hypothetical protein SAMN05216386_0893 [Nitrosospira briensis]